MNPSLHPAFRLFYLLVALNFSVALGTSSAAAQAPSQEPGAPRAWEAGAAVNPFSTFNLWNGNLITAIRLVRWDPGGPPVEFTIYHNSASALAQESGQSGNGIFLGYGWSTSYSGRIIQDHPNYTVVEDDGTRSVFVYDNGVYVPPTGVHDRLEYDGGEPKVPDDDLYILTRPNQWKRMFNWQGKLIEVVDSAGLKLTLERSQTGRLTAVICATEGNQNVTSHRLVLTYTAAARVANNPRPADLPAKAARPGSATANLTFPFRWGPKGVDDTA